MMRLRVVDAESGQPVPGASVTRMIPLIQPLTAPVPPFVCTVWWEEPAKQATDDHGRCEVKDPMRLRVWQKGYQMQEVRTSAFSLHRFGWETERVVKLRRATGDSSEQEPPEPEASEPESADAGELR
jgi:hypothetical protein